MAMNLKHKRVLQNSLTTWRTWIISWHQSWRSYTWTRNLWTATFLFQIFHFFPTTWKTGHLPHLQSTVSVGCVVWGFLQGRIPWPEGRAQHLENCALRTAEPNLKDFAEIVNAFAFCLFVKFVMKCESNSNSFVTSISTRRFISLFHPLSWFNTEHRSFAKQVPSDMGVASSGCDRWPQTPCGSLPRCWGPQFQAANLGENPKVLHIALDTLSWFQSNSIHFVSFHSLHFVGHVASQIFFTAYIVSVCSSLAHQTSEERCRTP